MNEISTPTPEEETTPPKKTPPPKKPAAEPKKPSTLFANLLAVVTLALVAAAGYYGYQHHLMLTAKVASFEQSQQAEQNRYQGLQQQLRAVIEQTTQQNQQLKAQYDTDMAGLTNQLLATREKLANLEGASEQSWQLDEAYYLLRIANNRLLFLGDIDTAVSLLKQADELLAKMDLPDLFLTRKKLAEDIQRLNAYPRLDRTGIAIRVGAMQAQVADLPMILITPSDEIETAKPKQVPETWYEHLSASFQQLSNQWFDVRPHGKGYNPLISEQDEQQLRFAMMMTLQTIQYSILYSNNDLFHATLLQLKSRLSNYFDAEDSQVRAILLEVEQLLEIKVTPESISPLASLSALNSFRIERDKPEESATETEQPDVTEVSDT